MSQSQIFLRWKFSANYLYPLLNFLICRRVGHSFKPDGPFLPSCRLCGIALRKPEQEKGFSLIELLIVVATIGVIAAIGVPRLTAAKYRAQAASAVASLRSIATSQFVYNQTKGGYADFATLSESGLMPDSSVTSGKKSGYRFTLSLSGSPKPGYTATAEPVDPSYGTPHYFLDETGVIRFEVRGPATAASEPVR